LRIGKTVVTNASFVTDKSDSAREAILCNATVEPLVVEDSIATVRGPKVNANAQRGPRQRCRDDRLVQSRRLRAFLFFRANNCFWLRFCCRFWLRFNFRLRFWLRICCRLRF
jgi:hypothetical protein